MNQLTIIGNLTKAPELRVTTSGHEVCNFTVAVNRRQKAANGESVADFFRVSAWDEKARNCATYLAKGKKVCVVGSVSVNTYTGNDGETRAQMEVMANTVEFLSPKEGYTKVEDEDNPFVGG